MSTLGGLGHLARRFATSLSRTPPPPQPQTWEDIAEIVSSVSPMARPTSRIARLPR